MKKRIKVLLVFGFGVIIFQACIQNSNTSTPKTDIEIINATNKKLQYEKIFLHYTSPFLSSIATAMHSKKRFV